MAGLCSHTKMVNPPVQCQSPAMSRRVSKTDITKRLAHNSVTLRPRSSRLAVSVSAVLSESFPTILRRHTFKSIPLCEYHTKAVYYPQSKGYGGTWNPRSQCPWANSSTVLCGWCRRLLGPDNTKACQRCFDVQASNRRSAFILKTQRGELRQYCCHLRGRWRSFCK